MRRCVTNLTLAGKGHIATFNDTRGDELMRTLRASPLIKLELRYKKNKRVRRDEKRPMTAHFKAFGHLMTSQVSSKTKNDDMFFFHR